MDRINTATKAVDLYGAGKHGFKNSNVGLGTPATDFNAEWANGVQEEHLNVIEAAGIVPAIATLTQMRQAIKRLAGANLRTITVVGPTALTADDAGVVLLDATANAVTVTLPAANLVTAVPLEFVFVRLDTTANAVTVNRAGADTFVGGGTSVTLVGRGMLRSIRTNAAALWVTTALGGDNMFGAPNQTFASVSRSAGTTYTNSTGRPIFISIYGVTSAPNGFLQLTIDGNVQPVISQPSNASGVGLMALIPPGSTYVFAATSVTVNTVYEYR